MSVLLDALKNAALEKQRRDKSSNGEDTARSLTREDETTPLRDINDVEENDDIVSEALHNEELPPVDDTTHIELDVDFDELERLAVENQGSDIFDTSSASTEFGDTSESSKKSEIDIVVGPVLDLNLDQDEQEGDLEAVFNDEVNPSSEEPKAIDSSIPEEPLQVDNLDKGPEADTAKKDDSPLKITAVEDSSFRTTTQEQKHSFQELLLTNKRISRKRQIRFAISFSVLVLISCMLMGGYYTYVVSQPQGLGVLIPIAAENETFNLEPVQDQAFIDDVDASGAAVPANEAESTLAEKSIKHQPVLKQSNPSSVSALLADDKVGERKVPSQPVLAVTKKPQVAQKPSSTASSKVSPDYIQRAGEPKAPAIDRHIHRAFTAYSEGDFTKAETEYAQAWQLDSNNRDVILGRAAVAIQLGKYEQAMNLYQKQLERHPRDDYAHSGILALASIDNISPAILSRTNVLLVDHPEAAHLHFLKGSLLAGQHQWTVAQASFFNAWTRAPDRVDYAYNLAIALDHIGEVNEALRFYRRVVDRNNASNGSDQINIQSIALRIKELEILSE